MANIPLGAGDDLGAGLDLGGHHSGWRGVDHWRRLGECWGGNEARGGEQKLVHDDLLYGKSMEAFSIGGGMLLEWRPRRWQCARVC